MVEPYRKKVLVGGLLEGEGMLGHPITGLGIPVGAWIQIQVGLNCRANRDGPTREDPQASVVVGDHGYDRPAQILAQPLVAQEEERSIP